MRRDLIQLLILTTALGPVAVLAQQRFFEVPNGLLTVEGNDASRFPFAYLGPVRYQQVYEASQFSLVHTGGAYLTRIFFRRDCASSNNWIVTNLQVNLSTTLKTADHLSAVFAENIGDDETVVFGPRNYIPPGGNSSSCPAPQTFATGQELNLDIAFYYDPARGSLLMDLRQSNISWKLADPPLDTSRLDAETVLGDSISRVVAFSLTSSAAEMVDTTGLVTGFQFDPIPSLTNSLTTNGVVITWPTLPNTFVFQWSDRLGVNTVWQTYTNEIGGGGLYRMVTIPFQSLKSAEFFRLAWEDARPIPRSRERSGAVTIQSSTH